MQAMAGEDQTFMRAALELAARGRGAVEPNPMVGAVIVRNGVEIAGGWHRKFGGPHAEVEAIEAARRAGADVRGATMYVTLEPCCHHGKTPPCTELIVNEGLARVVVATIDPDEHVSGRGVEQIRSGGIAVSVGLCRAEARELLAAYIKLRTQGRPWVICKWAQTADGCLALPPGAGRWISNEKSRAYSHELRGLSDGILVGVGTVLTDDPLLTNRSGRGRQPARVVLDSHLRTPAECQLVTTAAVSPVLVATTPEGLKENQECADRLRTAGVEVLHLPAGQGGVSLDALLDELGRRRWTYLLVEGGAKVHASFIGSGLADEIVAFVSPREAGSDAAGLPRLDVRELERKLSLKATEMRSFEDDVMRRYRVEP